MARDRFVLHRCDIRDAEGVARIVTNVKPDVLFHLAAIHYIPACESAPGNSVSVNVSGTVNLLDAAAPGTKFVFASTAAVYSPSLEPHRESESPRPVDIYGFTKLHGEQFVRYYHGKGKVRGVIVRLFNVVGPGETNPHLVPAVIKQVSGGARELELGNLFPHRDYIDVSDVAHGFRALGALSPALHQPVIVSNLGTGRTNSVEEIVELIGKASNQTFKIIQDPDRIRAVDRPMLKASTERLRELTGWAPELTTAQSMLRSWNSRVEDGFA
jgi:UDP-glucose 4-epimerase